MNEELEKQEKAAALDGITIIDTVDKGDRIEFTIEAPAELIDAVRPILEKCEKDRKENEELK